MKDRKLTAILQYHDHCHYSSIVSRELQLKSKLSHKVEAFIKDAPDDSFQLHFLLQVNDNVIILNYNSVCTSCFICSVFYFLFVFFLFEIMIVRSLQTVKFKINHLCLANQLLQFMKDLSIFIFEGILYLQLILINLHGYYFLYLRFIIFQSVNSLTFPFLIFVSFSLFR